MASKSRDLMGRSTRQGHTGRGGLRIAAPVCALMILLAGCSAPAGPSGSPESVSSTGDSPTFRGPWAAEFESAYRKAGSDFERSVLRDGEITDQELAETRDRFTDCLSAIGLSRVVFEPDGTFQFDAPEGVDPDTTNDRVKRCSTESGESSIGALHSWIRRNPQNQDEATIMAACLVRKKAVEPSYAAADYTEDAPTQDFPYLSGGPGSVAFQECTVDPLGLFE